MISSSVFWIFQIGLASSWELVLINPSHVFYWIILCVASALYLAWFCSRKEEKTKQALLDQISFVLLSIGIFWWVLWLDFEWLKFASPVLFWAIFAYLTYDSAKNGVFSKNLKLAIFFGGIFFWSTIAYGLLTVIGWGLWLVLLIFFLSFALISWPSICLLGDHRSQRIKAWFLILFLSAELFSVIAWLPFTGPMLSVILTIGLLFIYDLEKYYISPEKIRTKIIAKKIFVYLFFLAGVLFSTPWH